MPFSLGTYTAPAGATSASPGQVLQSAVWDAIFSDITTAFNNVLTRTGYDNAETVIASAATVDLSTSNSLRVLVTGTNTITSFGTGANLIHFVRFNGSLTLTYNAVSLILPGAQNIQTFAGDEAIFTSDASGNWRCISWLSNDGMSIVHQPDFRNLLYANGSFDIWQRGAGGTASIAVGASTTAYTADRWYLTTGANQASVVAQATALVSGSLTAGSVQRNNGQTGVTSITFGYPLTSDEITRLRGKPISISFFAQAGANWSPTNGTLSWGFYTGTGSSAKRGGGFTGETTIATGSVNVTAGGSVTAGVGNSGATLVPANASQAEFQFTWTPVGTAGAADTITIDDVQVEGSTNATAYDRVPFQVCLQACLRHYRKTFPYSVAPAQGAGLPGALAAISAAAAAVGVYWSHTADPMRATATYTTYNPSGASANWQDVTAAASLAATVDTANGVSQNGALIYSAAAAAAAHLIYIHAQADAGI